MRSKGLFKEGAGGDGVPPEDLAFCPGTGEHETSAGTRSVCVCVCVCLRLYYGIQACLFGTGAERRVVGERFRCAVGRSEGLISWWIRK